MMKLYAIFGIFIAPSPSLSPHWGRGDEGTALASNSILRFKDTFGFLFSIL